MARASALTALSEAFEDWAAADAAATRNESRRTRSRVISCLPAPRARASHRLYRAEREEESTGRVRYLSQSRQCQFNACWQRILRIDHGFRQSDRFKARAHVQIELEIAIARGMRAQCALLFETPLGGFFRTHAFEDTPVLLQRSGYIHDVIDLVAARERPSVQKQNAIRIPLQQVASGFQHDLQAEVILPRRVFNFVRCKEGVPNLVFTDQPAGGAPSQFAGERTLTGAGKPSHQHYHVGC